MRYYWPEYLQDLELYLQQCHRCLDRGNPQRRRAPLQCYNSGAPFERVAVDLLGPFPRTPGGNAYLVTAYATFTRWPEAIPVPDISARTVASALLYHVFTRFGIPCEPHSDRGPTFRRVLKTNKQFGEARNKQAIQRGAEQTSNSARRGTNKQFAVPLDKQATAFLTNFSYRGKNFQRCWINQQVSLSQPYWRH